MKCDFCFSSTKSLHLQDSSATPKIIGFLGNWSFIRTRKNSQWNWFHRNCMNQSPSSDFRRKTTIITEKSLLFFFSLNKQYNPISNCKSFSTRVSNRAFSTVFSSIVHSTPTLKNEQKHINSICDIFCCHADDTPAKRELRARILLLEYLCVQLHFMWQHCTFNS